MAKTDTFFLRTKITSSASLYVSDNIDISAYTSPATGKVLVVDRAFITFSNDGQGPIVPADVGVDISRAMGVQCCSEKQTSLGYYSFLLMKFASLNNIEHPLHVICLLLRLLGQ